MDVAFARCYVMKTLYVENGGFHVGSPITGYVLYCIAVYCYVVLFYVLS